MLGMAMSRQINASSRHNVLVSHADVGKFVVMANYHVLPVSGSASPPIAHTMALRQMTRPGTPTLKREILVSADKANI